jgi:hypothetical protein
MRLCLSLLPPKLLTLLLLLLLLLSASYCSMVFHEAVAEGMVADRLLLLLPHGS